MKEKATQIIKKLKDKGFEAVFAGGCVRDMLMKLEPKDFDIATSASVNDIKRLFPHSIPVGENFGVVIVMDGKNKFEVATFRKDIGSDGRRPEEILPTTMRGDALRRDLTINGIFFDPISKTLFDFVNGETDIKSKTIRFIGEATDRIREDHLRILRAIRFFSKSREWNMERDTLLALEINRDLLKEVSNERIREELEKMLLLPEPSIAFNMMLKLRILDVILPELAILNTIPQNPKFHLEGNAFAHTMLSIDTARKLSDDPIVLWGALFHDLGKGRPDIDENENLIFHDHDVRGSEIADKVLKRLKFSNEDRKTIVNIVADHMRVKKLPEMRKSKIRRLMAQEHFDRLLLVSDIDSRSSLHEDHLSDEGKRMFVVFAEIFKDTLDAMDRPMIPESFVNGNDLIDLGLKPGPKFKTILKTMEDLQLDGVITSREEALKFLIKMLD